MFERVKAWCVRVLPWLGPALAFVFGALVFRRREAPKPVAPPDTGRLEELRAKMTARADEAGKEAEEHRVFAEQRKAEAETERDRIRDLPADELEREVRKYTDRMRAGKGGALLVLLGALVSSPCEAQHAVQLEREGAPGWWVPDDLFRDTFSKAAVSEPGAEAFEEMRKSLEKKTLEADDLRVSIEIEAENSAGKDARHRATLEALERQSSVWRSAKLWAPVAGAVSFVLGVLLGGSL